MIFFSRQIQFMANELPHFLPSLVSGLSTYSFYWGSHLPRHRPNARFSFPVLQHDWAHDSFWWPLNVCFLVPELAGVPRQLRSVPTDHCCLPFSPCFWPLGILYFLTMSPLHLKVCLPPFISHFWCLNSKNVSDNLTGQLVVYGRPAVFLPALPPHKHHWPTLFFHCVFWW